jgi:DNA invertase Pin-like site-specific DNA recombinase
MGAQRDAVQKFLAGGDRILICEFREQESGKRVKNRPELQKAIEMCRKEKAVLLIANLSRLSRNAAFLLNLRDSGVKFCAIDNEHADDFTVGLLALLAEREQRETSQRTIRALEQCRKRGIALGNPQWQKVITTARKARSESAEAFRSELLPVIESIRKAGVESALGICKCLKARGVKSMTGKDFAPQTVRNYLKRAGISSYLENSCSSFETSKS